MLCSVKNLIKSSIYYTNIGNVDGKSSELQLSTTHLGSVLGNTVEPVLGDLLFGRPLVLCDHNHRHGSF